ncbi:hypothetical protein AAFF_G00003680 [Aldrovandia affinis]|uniref:Uncharacterized protein n=1 Tax=Aldrovandia affinis TaxID=143900 RepID=A0AAD7TDB1_9TELE|nr:hypothetical protein AAFF_G00003680 [Aldrovandia affinis]
MLFQVAPVCHGTRPGARHMGTITAPGDCERSTEMARVPVIHIPTTYYLTSAQADNVRTSRERLDELSGDVQQHRIKSWGALK